MNTTANPQALVPIIIADIYELAGRFREYGETIVMRLLDPRSIKGKLEDLGMRPDFRVSCQSPRNSTSLRGTTSPQCSPWPWSARSEKTASSRSVGDGPARASFWVRVA